MKKFINLVLVVCGILFLFFTVLPAVIGFFIPILGVVGILLLAIIAVGFVVKIIL